jgi:hypothetical protein
MLILGQGRLSTLSGRPTVSKADTLLCRNRHPGCEWEAPNNSVYGRAATSGAMSRAVLRGANGWQDAQLGFGS